MSNIHLVCAGEWFDLIASGKKKSEYRAVTDFYKQKLFAKKYETITISRGYTQNKLKFKINGIVKTKKKNDLNLPMVYEIKLGEKL